MAFTFDGSTQYLSSTSAPITAYPYTMAAWINPTTASTTQTIMNLGQNVGLGVGHAAVIAIRSTGTFGAGVFDGGFSQSTTGTVQTSKWQHCCGVFAGSAARTAYLDGVAGAQNTVTRNPTLDRLGVAATFRADVLDYYSGLIAEIGLWNVALTASEVASLAAGVSCRLVRPQSLVFYAPMIRNLIDTARGLTLTNNNAATVAVHPRMYA